MLKAIFKLLSRDNLQAQALAECHEMLDICEEMIVASVESLRRSEDAEIPIDIAAMDQKLNAFERDVRRKVMTHLSLGNRGDLTSGLILVSIVIDLERIGDYSKNIHDLARSHPSKLHGGPLEEQIAHVEKESLGLFRRAAKAWKAGDEAAVRELMLNYKGDISRTCREIEEALVSGRVEMSASNATALALYTRFLKRISAHSRNLASSVVNPFDRIGYPE
jgi:Na+/phosphate symporter